MQIGGLPELRYLIQSSSNLITWPPLATNTFVGASTNWLDRTATNTQLRFYRSAWLP